MKKATDGLEPKLLWQHFFALSQIPRCSKHEEQVRDYVLEVAQRRNCLFKDDRAGNVAVAVPASPGCEHYPIVVLQAHLDMVCEKNNETKHDFEKEGLLLIKDGDWISAEGTTLGADNGIGVAASLAMLDTTTEHGPLELLFTVDEETGLTGAMELDPAIIEGRMMINMDSEEDGAIYIGCAGGKDTTLSLKVETEENPKGRCISIILGGLKGGHSGIEIQRGRANAIKQLARFLWSESETLGLRIASIFGGNKHNAIPRECEAVVFCPQEGLGKLQESLLRFQSELKDEYGEEEPALFCTMAEKEKRLAAACLFIVFSAKITKSPFWSTQWCHRHESSRAQFGADIDQSCHY